MTKEKGVCKQQEHVRLYEGCNFAEVGFGIDQETVSMDVSYFNVADEGDMDQLEINDQEDPFTNAHFEFEGDMLEEESDEEVWRPEDNTRAF